MLNVLDGMTTVVVLTVGATTSDKGGVSYVLERVHDNGSK